MDNKCEVFISYSSKESAAARQVKNVLTTNGISCWMAPESIPGGSSYVSEIPKAIQQCKVLVLILSANAQKSKWVSGEVLEAVNRQKIIIPFAIEDCPLNDDFNFMIGRAQRIDAYNKKSASLERLVKNIRSITEPDIEQNPAPAPKPKKKRRITAIVLAAAVVTAFAGFIAYEVLKPNDKVDSTNWSFDGSENGNMVVTSRGNMTDYTEDNLTSRPWNGFSDRVKTLSFDSGVTSVGDCCFYNFNGIESVNLPNTLTKIGDYSFLGCVNIRSLTIPDGVQSIGDYAFFGCERLSSVNIPDSVVSIGAAAFSCCPSIEKTVVPETVSYIGSCAFGGCEGLSDIAVASGNKYYTAVDGNLYDAGKTTLLQYAAGKADSAFTVPDGVTDIGTFAFYMSNNLTEVSFPESVTEISNSAFSGCAGLETVKLPQKLTSIAPFAFSGCERLSGVTIPDGVTAIGKKAFYDCGSLESIVLPDGVLTIDNEAFANCESLKSITIPDSVANIAGDAFAHCDNLTITCGKNSKAETYAIDNNINYILGD